MVVYHLGDKVAYGSHGVCIVSDIEKKRIDKKLVEYYVLEPVDNAGCKYFVPAHNEIAVSKIRKILTRDQVISLLDSAEIKEDVWIEVEDHRKNRYKELISANDLGALLSMVHCLYIHKKNQELLGRKFHLSDENFLRDAQKLLECEISVALGVTTEEARAEIVRVFES